MTYGQGVIIASNVPTIQGSVLPSLSFSISPDLPAGLSLDPVTGTISGTPTGVPTAQNYTVIVRSSLGAFLASAVVNITIAPSTVAPNVTLYSFDAAGTNDVIPGWPASSVLDGNPNTIYSSSLFASINNDHTDPVGNPTYLFATLSSGPVNINEFILTARPGNQGFPLNYQIYTTPSAPSGQWTPIGIYWNQPDATGKAVIGLPQTYSTAGILLIPQTIGADSSGNHYFQMADMQMGMQTPVNTVVSHPINVNGYVDSVSPVTGGGAQIVGWACIIGSNDPVSIQIYAGNPDAGGTLLTTALSNAPSELAVASLCQNSASNLRYSVLIPPSQVAAYAGKPIYVRAANLSSFNLNSSGLYALPTPTNLVGTLTSVTPTASGGATLTGWACAYSSNVPLNVQASVGRPYGAGGALVGSATANLAGNPSLATFCGTSSSSFGFSISLSSTQVAQNAGLPIYVSTTTSSAILQNSGSLTVPVLAYGAITGATTNLASGTNTITGWSCLNGATLSDELLVYAGGLPGAGGALIAEGNANLSLGATPVPSVCNSTYSNIAFSIPITKAVVNSYLGKMIYIVEAHSGMALTLSGSIPLTLPSAPMGLSYSIPANLTVNVAISPISPTVSGSVSSYSVSPALPAGLTLNTSTGVVSGKPTALTSSVAYTFTASNAGGSSSKSISFAIVPVAPSGLNYTVPAAFTVGLAITPISPTVTGTVASYSVSPAFPAGIALNATTGVISGTPTASVASATHTITATNAGGSTTKAITFAVNMKAPSGLSYNVPAKFFQNVLIAPIAPVVTGTVTTYSVSPALPAGLVLNASTGLISGIPTALTATTSYGVTATNNGGSSQATLSISVVVAAPSQLTYSAPSATFVKGVWIANDSPSVQGGPIPRLIRSLQRCPRDSFSTPPMESSREPRALSRPALPTRSPQPTRAVPQPRPLTFSVVDAAPSSLTYANPSPVYYKGSQFRTIILPRWETCPLHIRFPQRSRLAWRSTRPTALSSGLQTRPSRRPFSP